MQSTLIFVETIKQHFVRCVAPKYSSQKVIVLHLRVTSLKQSFGVSKGKQTKIWAKSLLLFFLIACLYNFNKVLLDLFYIKMDFSRLKTLISRSCALYFLYKNKFYTEGCFFKKNCRAFFFKNSFRFLKISLTVCIIFFFYLKLHTHTFFSFVCV